MDMFKSLCKPDYGSVKHNMELVNLTVFIRNGDRAPTYGENHGWHKRMCIKCKNIGCMLKHCANDMLTVRGYKQGHDVAAFIKQEYYPRFESKSTEYRLDRNKLIFSRSNYASDISPQISINGYYYKTNKSNVFLTSITDMLEYSSLKLHPIKEIGCEDSCLSLRNSFFSKNDSERLSPSSEFDRIIGSLCNDAPIECGRFGCDLMKMEEYMVQEKQNFEDNLTRMREDIIASFIGFSPLSKFMLEIMPKSDINIVSVTGETIITLLAGLNTQNADLIPYAGAVFIELWKDKTGKEFYSVNYNGKRMKFGLFKEEYVAKKEFEKFLKMFAKNSNKIHKICNYSAKRTSEEHLLAMKKEKIRELSDPLIKELHKRRVLIK